MNKRLENRQTIIKTFANILMVTLVVLLIIFAIKVYKETRNNTRLQSLEVYGYKLDKPFKENEYVYKVTVDKNYIQVSCDTTDNIVGCNQNIDLTDEEEYIHEIVVDPTGENKIYLLYITNETSKDETQTTTDEEKVKAPWVPEYPQDNVVNWVPAIDYNKPVQPEEPVEPEEPVQPTEPVEPAEPAEPVQPEEPGDVVDIVEDKEPPEESIPPVEPEIKPELPNITITSIEGNPTNWTNKNVQIKVNVKSDKDILAYSFDGGLTWQDSNIKEIDKNQILEIIVKDVEGNTTPKSIVDITKIDKEKPQALIYIDSIDKDGINLKITSDDIGSGIDLVSFLGGNYTNQTTYRITKAGTYYVTVKDKAGNISEKASIDIKDSDFITLEEVTKTFTATFDGNGSDASTTLTCTTEVGQDSCKIKTPKIVRNGWESVGWSTNKYSIDKEYSQLEEIELTSDITLYAITSRTLMAHFNVNGANPLDEDDEYKTCNLYNKQTSCTLSSTVITSREGWQFLGWSTNKDSHKVDIKAGEAVVLTSDKVELYAITAKELFATFNGEKTGIPEQKTSCYIYNSETGCYINVPKVTKDGFDISGWRQSNNNKLIPMNESVLIESDVKYLLEAKEVTPPPQPVELTVCFYSNGADSMVTSTGTYNDKVCNTCTATDDNGCYVTSPKIKRNGDNVTIYGFSSSSTSKTANIKSGDKIKVTNSTNNAKYYAITSKEITITFDKNGHDGTIEYSSKSCTLYNNGNCSIKIPYLYVNGYQVFGFNSTKNYSGADPEYLINNTAYFYDDDTVYADFTSDYAKKSKTMTAGTTMKVGNIQIEFDGNMKNNVVNVINSRKKFINFLYSKMPFLFRNNGKIRFMSRSKYNAAWGATGGMTYGWSIYKLIDINEYSTLAPNQTLVHELAHKFDFENGKLSQTTEWENLYNKYKNQNVLTTYSKTNPQEFFADAVSVYFFKNYVTNSEYYEYIGNSKGEEYRNNVVYPEDIKAFIKEHLK